MTQDRGGEIPQGFVLRHLPEVNAQFPMPETWFYKHETTDTNLGFFLTREPIVIDQYRYRRSGSVGLKTSNPEGFFQTGLSLNVTLHFDALRKIEPSRFARRFMTNIPPITIPTSRAVETINGDLVTVRRFVKIAAQTIMGVRSNGISMYMEATGNDATGTVYLAQFETPTELWAENEEIAKIMIEGRVLDQTK